MLSTEGLKMSRNSYNDSVSSIIKNSHQSRSFYCALYVLILRRGEASAFSFTSLCQCRCSSAGSGHRLQLWLWWHLGISGARPQFTAGQRSQHGPSSSFSGRNSSSAPVLLQPHWKHFSGLQSSKAKKCPTPFRAWQYSFHKSFLHLPHFQQLVRSCLGRHRLVPEHLPGRVLPCTLFVCPAWCTVGYVVDLLRTLKLSCIEEDKKIKVFVFSESFQAKQAAPALNPLVKTLSGWWIIAPEISM